MKITNSPNPDEELAILAPLVISLFEAFEAATEEACLFFESKDRVINLWLYPELVRYYVKEYLETRGQMVEDLNREEIGKNGLCVVFQNRRIRIWKADDDELPAPGPSQSKFNFLNQQLSWTFADIYDPKPVDLNLVILWNVDSNRRLSKLYLSCPKLAEARWKSAEAYWTVPIEYPGISDTAVPSRPQEPIAPEDLPITFLEQDTDENEEIS